MWTVWLRTNANAYSDANSNRDCNDCTQSDSNAYFDDCCESDADANSNCNDCTQSDADANSHSNADINSSPNAYSHAGSDAYSHAMRTRWVRSNANPNPDGHDRIQPNPDAYFDSYC